MDIAPCVRLATSDRLPGVGRGREAQLLVEAPPIGELAQELALAVLAMQTVRPSNT